MRKAVSWIVNVTGWVLDGKELAKIAGGSTVLSGIVNWLVEGIRQLPWPILVAIVIGTAVVVFVSVSEIRDRILKKKMYPVPSNLDALQVVVQSYSFSSQNELALQMSLYTLVPTRLRDMSLRIGREKLAAFSPDDVSKIDFFSDVHLTARFEVPDGNIRNRNLSQVCISTERGMGYSQTFSIHCGGRQFSVGKTVRVNQFR